MPLHLTRRSLLASMGAALVLPRPGLAASTTITARAGKVQLAPDGYPETAIWGYDGGVPGPILRVAQGDRLQRTLVNELPQPTAIHWHGARTDNTMDGVPGMTQEAVPTGGSFAYDAPMPDAGTFWYHSHNHSAEQVARGLFGALIVEEPEAVDVDHDIVVMADDWRLTEQAQIHESFGAMHDLSHGGRLGNFIHLAMEPSLTQLKRHDRLRLRLINPSTDRIILLRTVGLEGWVMALDGMPLDQPEPLENVLLAPAQRADVFVDVTAEVGDTALIVEQERDQGYVMAEFTVTDGGSRARRQAPAALPPNPVQRATLGPDMRRLEMRMEGGAMGGLREGTYQGQRMSMRELVSNGQFWTLNGTAGLPDDPFADLSRGESVEITLINDTAFPHGMHLHGHHFQEVLPGGRTGPFRDTLLVDCGNSRRIAFVADNPGKWLIHCHMLSHQTAGMKTWVRVG